MATRSLGVCVVCVCVCVCVFLCLSVSFWCDGGGGDSFLSFLIALSGWYANTIGCVHVKQAMCNHTHTG